LIALDTNFLVYAASVEDASGRHKSALQILDELAKTGAILPLPIVGELFNACRKKKFAEIDAVAAKMGVWKVAFDCASASIDDYLKAAQLCQQHNLQYFDALIMTVAARAGATILLSEDMQDGFQIEGLKIVNPFAAANETLLADYFANAL
jgi:predicted nucleic acid-binding protein